MRIAAKPGCTWQDFCTIATEYEVIKADYWAELTTEEIDLIAALEKAELPPVIQVGSIQPFLADLLELEVRRVCH